MNMSRQPAFAEALDAAEQLDPEAQAELIEVLSRRLAERGRERIEESVAQARREYAAGQCVPMTATEIVNEARS
jgi:ribose 1,5-bisphosphokinase PhnN